MTYCFWDFKSQRIFLNFGWVSIFFDILIAIISWTVAQIPMNHIIFWKSVMRPFRWIHVNCFNRLRCLAEVSTKLQKMYFLGHFKNNNSIRILETRQMTPFFSSTISTLTVCNIHFCFSKYSKFIFMWSPLRFIMVYKTPQFWTKTTDSDSPSYFSRK